LPEIKNLLEVKTLDSQFSLSISFSIRSSFARSNVRRSKSGYIGVVCCSYKQLVVGEL